MFKRTLLSSLLVFITAYAEEEQSNAKENNIKQVRTDVEMFGLLGKVKSIKANFCYATEKLGEPQKGECYGGLQIYFNQQGDTVEEVTLNGKEESVLRFIRHTNDKGLYIKGETIDLKGQLIGISKPNLLENGLLKSSVNYDKNGNIVNVLVLEYDNNWNTIRATVKKPDNNVESRIISEYNSKNQKVFEKVYGEKNRLIREETYSYTENGKLPTKSHITLYNDGNGSILDCWAKYNKVDKQGNWTQKAEYKRDTLYQVVEREIEYY